MNNIHLKNIRCPKCGEYIIPPHVKRFSLVEGATHLIVPCFICGEKVTFSLTEEENKKDG